MSVAQYEWTIDHAPCNIAATAAAAAKQKTEKLYNESLTWAKWCIKNRPSVTKQLLVLDIILLIRRMDLCTRNFCKEMWHTPKSRDGFLLKVNRFSNSQTYWKIVFESSLLWKDHGIATAQNCSAFFSVRLVANNNTLQHDNQFSPCFDIGIDSLFSMLFGAMASRQSVHIFHSLCNLKVWWADSISFMQWGQPGCILVLTVLTRWWQHSAVNSIAFTWLFSERSALYTFTNSVTNGKNAGLFQYLPSCHPD